VKRVVPDSQWPESWRYSHAYDLIEVYGSPENSGYRLAYQTRKDAALDLVRALLPLGSHVLDVAAAQGNFSLAMAEYGYKVTWNDLREDLAGYVQLKHEAGEVAFLPGNILEVGSAGSFDGVLATEVIEHVAHPDRFLERMSELLRPGGVLVMTTPNGAYLLNRLPRFSDCIDPSAFESAQFGPNSDSHIFLLHPDELEELGRQAGLSLLTLKHNTTPLTAGHLKLRHLHPLLPNSALLRLERLAGSLPGLVKRRMMLQTAVAYAKAVK
jgi:2-polyprenyl-6-hydroxyphenyl methylase/3-demethylubiquinone-9 3-methyltransferase